MTRTDQGIKVFKLMTETDAPGQLASRQPDTDEYRRWEWSVPRTRTSTS